MDMIFEFIKSMGQNVAVILLLVYFFSLQDRRPKSLNPVYHTISTGILFSLVAIISMHIPVTIMDGVVIDSRVVIVGLACLYSSITSSIIVAITASLYRFYLGGIGVFPGIGTIITAVVVTAILKRYFLKKSELPAIWHLPVIGAVLALVGLLWTFALPREYWGVIKLYAIPVIIFYPLSTLLYGLIINMHREQIISAKELKASVKNYQEIFDATSEAIFIIDETSGQILDVNKPMLEMYEYEKDEVLRLTIGDLSSGDSSYNQNAAQGKMENAILEGTLLFEWQAKKKSGELFWVEVALSSTAIGGSGRLLAVVRDISQRKQSDAEHETLQQKLHQSEKLNAIGQLAGGVAHDFNNLLGGIMGASEILLNHTETLDKTDMEFVNLILNASTRAADLTAKLLAFGRKGNVVSEVVDLNAIIDDTVSILNSTIDKKNEITVKQDAESHNTSGDISAIQNMVMNVVINASHAMQDEGGEIQIETKNIELSNDYCSASQFDIKPGQYIELEIRDNGCGISLDNLQKIFEPFYTTKKQGEGTGLGLAAAYGTIQDHNGSITVYSEEGAGTSFHILLPVSETDQNIAPIESRIYSGTGLVLLVDDEDIIRVTCAQQLKKYGYRVLVAKNGEEAVELYKEKQHEIDLVIMDMIMPKMNGREAVEIIKEIDKDCKVIISSGFTKEEDMAKLDKVGISGFIHKPFRDSELSKMISEVLKEL